jgi:UDP-4-amino-4,6-dideoxy-N-acetyl-beta-L-altrosamine transaminase
MADLRSTLGDAQLMSQFIPYGRQSLDESDLNAVMEVLKSDWLTQGPTIDRFERAVAEYCGAKYAVAVSNATAALHLACLAIGLKEQDTLWTSPNTFVASANCARYCGASIDFVDIDLDTYNLSVAKLREKLLWAAEKKCLPSVLVPVHFSGQACDMDAIATVAQEYGIHVIEDASHALGGTHQQDKIGSCQFSEMTVFSFHPVKMITTGEGGMILTNRLDLSERLKQLRSHGITREAKQFTNPAPGAWYYEQQALGFNYRMTELQAALGLSQLQRLDTFVQRRQYLANRYREHLNHLPVTLPNPSAYTTSSFHLYVIRLKLELLNRSQSEIFEALRDRGIGVQIHYIPVHTQPYYQKLGFQWGDFPIAEQYYREALSLPLYPALTEAEQDWVIRSLTEVLE